MVSLLRMVVICVQLFSRSIVSIDSAGNHTLVDSGFSGDFGLVSESGNGGLLAVNVLDPGNVALYRS